MINYLHRVKLFKLYRLLFLNNDLSLTILFPTFIKLKVHSYKVFIFLNLKNCTS